MLHLSDNDDDGAYCEYTEHSKTGSGNLLNRIFDCSVFNDCCSPSLALKKDKKKKQNKNKSRKDDSIKFEMKRTIPDKLSEDKYLFDEFITIMSAGMNLLLVSAIGSTRSVTLTTDGLTISWGLPKSKPMKYETINFYPYILFFSYVFSFLSFFDSFRSFAVNNVSCIQSGMPEKLIKLLADPADNHRAFTFICKDKIQPTTFLAPTSLERDALVNNFLLILSQLSSSEADRHVE